MSATEDEPTSKRQKSGWDAAFCSASLRLDFDAPLLRAGGSEDETEKEEVEIIHWGDALDQVSRVARCNAILPST